jgi:hypothetical protein
MRSWRLSAAPPLLSTTPGRTRLRSCGKSKKRLHGKLLNTGQSEKRSFEESSHRQVEMPQIEGQTFMKIQSIKSAANRSFNDVAEMVVGYVVNVKNDFGEYSPSEIAAIMASSSAARDELSGI